MTADATPTSGRNPRTGPFRWYGWAEALSRHPRLSDRGKLVAWQLAALADNDTGLLGVGRDRLAERVGRDDVRAATRALGELRDVAALALVTPGRGGRGRLDQVPVYRPSEAALEDVPPLRERGGVADAPLEERGGVADTGLALKGCQERPERGGVADTLPTGSPTRPAIAHAHEGGGGQVDERVRRVLDLLRPLGLVNATRLATLLSEHPEPDAEQVARELREAVESGRTTVERSVLGLYGSWLRNAPAAPPPKPWPPSEVDPDSVRWALQGALWEHEAMNPDERTVLDSASAYIVSLAGGVLHVQRKFGVRWTADDWEPAVGLLRGRYEVERVVLHEDPEAAAKAAASAVLEAETRKTLRDMGYSDEELREAGS